MRKGFETILLVVLTPFAAWATFILLYLVIGFAVQGNRMAAGAAAAGIVGLCTVFLVARRQRRARSTF